MSQHRISEDHPLRDFFRSLVHGSLHVRMGLDDRDIEEYLSGLVTEFAHAETSILEVDESAVDDLVHMVYKGDVRLEASSFEQERRVHKHIGDYIMFWAGVYPEQFKRLRTLGVASGFVDHVSLGKSSYFMVSTFDHGDYAREATLFRRLSDEFETYLFALHLVREAWEGDGREWSQGFRA